MHHQLNEPAGIRRLLFVFFPGCWLVATFPALTGIARGHLFYRERLLQRQWLAPFFPDEDQAMPPRIMQQKNILSAASFYCMEIKL